MLPLMEVWPKGECCIYCGETAETAMTSFLKLEELAEGLQQLGCLACDKTRMCSVHAWGNNCMCPERGRLDAEGSTLSLHLHLGKG